MNALRHPLPAEYKRSIPAGSLFHHVNEVLEKENLNTICVSGKCPNRGECFSRGSLAYMILGDICTRHCGFCAVPAGRPDAADPTEPERLARAAAALKLRHVVVTAVARDDMADGGAAHFAACIHALRRHLPSAAIEVLTSDFNGDPTALNMVLDAQPDIFNHNVETVERLTPKARSRAHYRRSLEVLRYAKEHATELRMKIKSGFMLGLGEEREEIRQTLRDLRAAGCDYLTIGQYLQPSTQHLSVQSFVPIEEFTGWKDEAFRLGFERVASGPLVRSSYFADQLHSPERMTPVTTLQRSPLHELHAHAGGKFVDFHGWELPVQFTSVIDEHQTVRRAAGLFDISHMGQVMIEGAGAFAFIQNLITNDLQRTFDKGLGVYAHLCLPTGGVIDDIFVYGLKDRNRFFMVVNGATHEKDVAWLRKNAPNGVSIMDLEKRAGFALQGPKALDILRKTIAGIAELPRFAFQQIKGGEPNETYWACRTGYTGEDGAEFFGPEVTIKTLWKQLLENGENDGIKPCGLGARDTLRLEAGYPLYGHELTEEHTSLEANMEWAVKWGKGDFVGREALWKQKQNGIKRKLLAYELLERGVPRQGCKLFKESSPGGETTSGTFSPSLQKGIGLAYAPADWSRPGTRLDVEIHNKRVPAAVVTLPFYKK